jgi:hypothetical protein
VDPVPDPLLLRESGNAGNRCQTSGYTARNYGHYITEAVHHGLVMTNTRPLARN